MPRLADIGGNGPDKIPVPELPWLDRALNGGFTRGGSYLLAGEPGIGKTTLAIQILGALANRQGKVLYISTEQGLADLKRAITRILGTANGLPSAISANFLLDDTVEEIDTLPRFFTRRVLTDGEEYHGVQAIVLDSVQGRGLSPAATKQYKGLYQFAEDAKAQGVTTFFIGHVTQKGQIAGPRDLQHNVDCIFYLRRAFRLRPFFVPKNRSGPAVLEPLVLVMDDSGRLIESPHRAAKSTAVLGYAGIGEELAEGQASVSLPRYASRPELNAPFLPGKKIRQLLSVLSALKDVDLTDLSYEINCYVPRQQHYREELDLPLGIALLSSYLQRAVPPKSLFIGELDLTRRIRAPEPTYLAALAELLCGPQRARIADVYISSDCAAELAEMRPGDHGPTVGESVKVHSVETLESLLPMLWPDLFKA
jgi:DNA repair protein RadA/Sms